MKNEIPETMDCMVFKSLRKDETYIFVREEADLDDLPAELARVLGQMEKVMPLTLTPQRKLARSDAREVMQNIIEQGFHLQMPENPQLQAIPEYRETLQQKKLR